MKPQRVLDYLPQDMLATDKDKQLVQAKVAREIVRDIKEYMDHTSLGWNEVISACLQKLREEIRGTKK